MTPQPLLEINDLTVRFSGQAVLSGINLSIHPGELVMAVGPSGSGKTTLLRAVNRLNEEFSGCETSGRIRIHLHGRWLDCYAKDVSLPELRLRMGMVFQHPNVLPFSIYKNVALPLRVSLGLDKAMVEQRVKQALKDVWLWDEIKDRLHDNALKLSGGQQQRLCLARALALEPAILLLDEPTASLDFKATRKIEALFQDLKQRYAILAVTHSLGQMRRLADRALVLRDGELVSELSRVDLENQESCRRIMEEIF
ncbi:phosphate ABC transporter ATP-binding protein [Desulfonatronum sp. SC1]|uniref:phosphate ABC transporter ATP-binding protein n=1 Tax=Desulfonatronum sp. SC1 TaxID=2109626 RepID=UPI000D2F6462|nr:ATP-binding cassette domain-containing protein [Desulfonatronum sp. SC1]PTN32237.1 phosphate ABC transporter ATP-binding protein [Desulfonatronum sp. SC1]